MAGSLNLEFDSRVLRTSIGSVARTKPSFTYDGELQRVYCLNCGKPGGAVTADIPPAMRNDPGVIYVCLECDARLGKMPLPAVSFIARRND